MSQRFGITLVVFWIIFVLAVVSALRAESPRYEGTFRVAVEDGYSSTKDGVQFIALQRIDSTEIDRAVLSIDADLPLAKALIALKSSRVRITVEAVEPRTMGELKR